mgnify:CR=1 FL=1
MWPFKNKDVITVEAKPLRLEDIRPSCSECACLIEPGREVIIPNTSDFISTIWSDVYKSIYGRTSYTYCQACRPAYDRSDSSWSPLRYYKTIPATEIEVDVDGKPIKKAAKKRSTKRQTTRRN